MIHDSLTTCSSVGYVMSTQVSLSNVPTQFSPCALDAYRYYMGNLTAPAAPTDSNPTPGPTPTCLDNRPVYAWALSPVCGNGFVETGETCDCGAADCSSAQAQVNDSRCCNGATCQLYSFAQCTGALPCCDPATCAVRTDTTVTCRPPDARSGGCDVAQTCNALNASCPNKAFAPAGTPCVNKQFGFQGFCDAADACSRLSEAPAQAHSSPLLMLLSMLLALLVTAGALPRLH
jgi:hypothetical protein